MAACARCGAANPEGNAFCQACGAPLAAAPPQPPGALTPPPAGTSIAPPGSVPPGAGLQPGTAPAPPPLPAIPPPARGGRLSRNVIIAIAVAALLLIGGAVVVFAAIHKGGSTPTPPAPSALPTAAPTARPTAQPTATAQPTTNPSPQPSTTPGPNGNTGVLNTIFVPTGWKDNGPGGQSGCPSNFDVVDGPGTSSTFEKIVYGGCSDMPAGTDNAAMDQAMLQSIQSAFDPNAAFCSNDGSPGPAKQQYDIQGSGGALPSDTFLICFTYTPQNGPAEQNEALFITATGTGADGSPAGAYIEFLFTQGQGNDSWISPLLSNVTSQSQFSLSGGS